jgi:predicted RNA-binding Zn-ribbon protein involved in translation (DUF1610 family)
VATVRATCPACGDVDLSTAGVQVQVCISTSVAAYSFQCPVCHVMVNRPANAHVVEALTQVGVRIVHWGLPAELSEPKIGPPITHDDLLSFHLALRDDSWQEELAGMRWRS